MSSRSAPVDGFRLAFGRYGSAGAPPVVLLHGWPGNRHDYRRVVPLLTDAADVIVPDLRGFGGSDKHAVAVRHFYSASAQASSVVGLINELGLTGVVLAGYDVGSRVAQSVARMYPDLAKALGAVTAAARRGNRVLTAAGSAGVLVSGVPPTSARRPADRRQPRRRPRVPAPLLEPLVRPEFHPLRRRSGSAGLRLRVARRVHRVDRVVPGGRRHGRPVAHRAAARSRHQDPGLHGCAAAAA